MTQRCSGVTGNVKRRFLGEIRRRLQKYLKVGISGERENV
jgi:hypothetical protein